MEMEIQSEEGWPPVVKQLLGIAGDRRKFALYGGLGAGKTTFAKYFCRHFGVQDEVSSPTYAIANQYVYLDSDDKEQLIHHLDLYRLKNLQEAYDIGIEDYLYDDHYCLIEWPELIEAILPENTVRINISALSPSSRKILFL